MHVQMQNALPWTRMVLLKGIAGVGLHRIEVQNLLEVKETEFMYNIFLIYAPTEI